MIKDLHHVRQKIDALDQQMHDLIQIRADLVKDVIAAKEKAGLQVVQPDREAMMINRLHARHHSIFPFNAIIRIWRELVGAVCLMQKGLRVALYLPHSLMHSLSVWDMARNYFGSQLPFQLIDNPIDALDKLHRKEIDFFILSSSDYENLIMEIIKYKNIQISIKLPYAYKALIEGDAITENYAYALSTLNAGESDHDRTVILCPSHIKLNGLSVFESKVIQDMTLYEIDGFYTISDIQNISVDIVYLGNYAVAP